MGESLRSSSTVWDSLYEILLRKSTILKPVLNTHIEQVTRGKSLDFLKTAAKSPSTHTLLSWKKKRKTLDYVVLDTQYLKIGMALIRELLWSQTYTLSYMESIPCLNLERTFFVLSIPVYPVYKCNAVARHDFCWFCHQSLLISWSVITLLMFPNPSA